MADLLELEEVVSGYGRVPVLHGVNLTVPEAEIVVILGANGAGKTTTLRATSGLIRLWGGAVRFDGTDIGRLSPERVARMGVGVVPEAPAGVLYLSGH